MVPKSEGLIPLTSGAYQERSTIGNVLIAENIFLEINPQETDPAAPALHVPREGKRILSSPPFPGQGRGIFTMSNGQLYAAVGPQLFYIDNNWQWNLLGAISNLLTPVSMSDNGVTAVLVDGTPNGYTVTLGTNAFANLVDSTGTFVGSRHVDFSDTFLAFAAPGTNEWYVTLSDTVTFNALVQANKDSTPDPIQTFAFNIRQMWLLGTQGTEVWYLAGSTPFPYQEWPNVFIPYGCAAPYSLVRSDVTLFWISQNLQGQPIALQTDGYNVKAISTRALEYEWNGYATVADCVGGTFQQAGHTFIVFNFPSADKTWVYDLSTKQWHRRTWTDSNGVAHRDKAGFFAAVSPSGGYPATIVGQDWATGQLYALDPKIYQDNGRPIVIRRSFPHVMADMHLITHTAFVADFETGGIVAQGEEIAIASGFSRGFSTGFGPLTSQIFNPNAPQLCMRVSRNGGATFGNYRLKGLVSSGNYRSMMRWRGLGMGRDMVYELLWSYNGPSALQGAYVETVQHGA